MRPYAIFAWMGRPAGGWDDMAARVATLQDAKDYFAAKLPGFEGHVVYLLTGENVWVFE